MPSKGPTAKRDIAPPQLPETTPTTTLPHEGFADHGVYTDVSLAHAELVGQAAWDKAQMARIEVIDSRLLGFKAIEARIQDALFKECNATLALFWSTTFKAVRFQTCVLREA